MLYKNPDPDICGFRISDFLKPSRLVWKNRLYNRDEPKASDFVRLFLFDSLTLTHRAAGIYL